MPLDASSLALARVVYLVGHGDNLSLFVVGESMLRLVSVADRR